MTTIASSFRVVRRWSNWDSKTNLPTTKLAMTTAEIAQSVANDQTAIAVEIAADAHHAAEVAVVAEAAVVVEAVAAVDAVAVEAAVVVEAAAVEVAAVAVAKTPFPE